MQVQRSGRQYQLQARVARARNRAVATGLADPVTGPTSPSESSKRLWRSLVEYSHSPTDVPRGQLRSPHRQKMSPSMLSPPGKTSPRRRGRRRTREPPKGVPILPHPIPLCVPLAQFSDGCAVHGSAPVVRLRRTARPGCRRRSGHQHETKQGIGQRVADTNAARRWEAPTPEWAANRARCLFVFPVHHVRKHVLGNDA